MKKSLIPGLCLLFSGLAQADEYLLAVQPIMPAEKLEQSYAPLASYLSETTGHTIKIQTFSGFKSYWYNMKRLKGFDMVIDAAHFVDYRVKNNNYRVLARLPNTVSYTVVTRGNLFVFDVSELADYKVATMDAPGVGGLRLMEMFEGAEKTPMTIGSYNADDCIRNIREGRADAAVIPTSIVDKYENLNVVTTTEPIPHMAFSVSPEVPKKVAQSVKAALLKADSTVKGREALKAADLPLFIDAKESVYEGYAGLFDVMTARKHN